MNAFSAVAERDPKVRVLEQLLSDACQHIAGGRYELATACYSQLLNTLECVAFPDLRREALTNLAALCLLQVEREYDNARKLDGIDRAFHLLHAARSLIGDAAPLRSLMLHANLALAHCRRYDILSDPADAMQAHLLLDGVEQSMRHADEPGMADWAASIRNLLASMRERRLRQS